MRFWARSFLVSFICCGLLNLQIQPAAAGPLAISHSESSAPKPFGIVIRTNLARISAATASAGATVYPGDSVNTELGGELRLAVGKGQLYLLSSSSADLGQAGEVLRASVVSGTVGFSSLTSKQFELATPEGIVRAANDRPAFGQVTLTGPNQMMVSTYSGTLVLERNDQRLEISPGQTYDVELVPDPASQGAAGVTKAYKDKIIWKLIVIGGAALAGYFIWRKYSQSPADPK